MRLITGLLKGPILGAILGAAVGFGFFELGAGNTGILRWIACGLAGAVAGFFCGKPVWRQSTLWTPLIKAIFGFAAGIGILALWMRILGNPGKMPAITAVGLEQSTSLSAVPFAMGGIIGLVWGGLVGLDEAFGDGETAKQAKDTQAKGKQDGESSPATKR